MHKANASATCGKVTVSVTGNTQHSAGEVRDCAFLTAEILSSICMEGEFKLIACPINFQGSQKLKGLSVKGIQNNAIILAYQPSGNQTRMKYLLHMSLDALHNRFESLKAVVGTAYLGKESAKVTPDLEPPATQIEEVISPPSVPVAVTKPTEKPKVYYTSDTEWMETFVLYLLELADTKLDKCVSKEDLFDLIVEHTHYKNRFGVGPIFNTLKSRGHIVAIEGQVDLYRVVGTPEVALKKPKATSKSVSVTSLAKAKGVKAKPVAVAPVTKSKRQKYLSDKEWMQSFMGGLQALVQENRGLISKKDLLSYIGSRTNQHKLAGTVYHVLDGLSLRGFVITAGDKLYKVVYEPKPDTVEKAVAGIERARAEADKVFEGFGKYRLPKFAEGMFDNPPLLDRLLLRLNKDEVSTAMTIRAVAEDYPGFSDASYSILVGYLCGRGYLIKSRHGWYTLGPEGRTRLGLPLPEAMVFAKHVRPPASLSADMVKRTDVQASEPVTPEVEPVSAEFLPSAPEQVTPNAVVLGLAKLATEGQAVATLIAEARERIAAKQARKSAALKAIAQKPNIDDLVTQRLLAEIDQL